MRDVEGGLLAGRPPRYVQLATAAVPDGESTVARWHELGKAQADRLGVEQVVVPVVDRSDADDPDLAALIAGAGLIYLSGGDPGYLARALRGTAVWDAIVRAWRAGSALAGCSAGAMVMAAWIPSWRDPTSEGTEGLALLPHVRVIPHFDRFLARVPDLVARTLSTGHPGVTVIGVDEDTAIVGGPHEWTVQGRQSAWVLTAEGKIPYAAGTTITTPSEP